MNELRAVAERFVNTTLLQIVEEPEQNLYPTSLVSAIRKLIKNTTSIGRLIVTTHSPYILSTVNNFMFAYVLGGSGTQTLPVALKLFIGYTGIDMSGLMAAAVVVTMPVVIISIILQKYVVSGLTAGAVKG